MKGKINIAIYFIAVAIAIKATAKNNLFFLKAKYIASKINKITNISLCVFDNASNNINGFSPYNNTQKFFLVIL